MALACELPAASGTPLAKWSCPARETAARGITASIPARTVRRWLAQDLRKPWRHRSWIFPRDPYFAVKAARVFDLYERIWEARPLGGDEYVPGNHVLIIQRKLLVPDDFADLPALAAKIGGFERRYLQPGQRGP
jgi:hypothetical protein